MQTQELRIKKKPKHINKNVFNSKDNCNTK